MSNSEDFESGCFNPFCCYVENKPRKKKPHGYRKIKYCNGTYIGDTKDTFFGRCREGHGKYTYENGDVYDGDWKGDVKEGRGTYTYKDLGVYEGEWKKGVREGYGKMTYEDGDVYKGDWKGDVKEGRGKITFKNGSAYDGDWKNDKWEGYGKLTYENGDFYEGNWKNDKLEGYGKFTFKDGRSYTADLKQNYIKQNRTIKKIPLDNAENIFLQQTDHWDDEEKFTKQNTKKYKTYFEARQYKGLQQENTNQKDHVKDHLKIMYCDHGQPKAHWLRKRICKLPNADGRKSYYISNAACFGAFDDRYNNNLVNKIKENIKGTDAVGFFSHILSNNNTCTIQSTIDKNNKIGLKRVPCCKNGLCVNDTSFNKNKDKYIRYYVILNEGEEQNIYQIPRDLCYWREVLIDDTETSDTEQYKNKFMEAVACLKAGRSFTFKTRAQVEVDGKLVKKYKTITISGEMKKVEIKDIIEAQKLDDESKKRKDNSPINNISSSYKKQSEKQKKEFNGNNINNKDINSKGKNNNFKENEKENSNFKDKNNNFKENEVENTSKINNFLNENKNKESENNINLNGEIDKRGCKKEEDNINQNININLNPNTKNNNEAEKKADRTSSPRNKLMNNGNKKPQSSGFCGMFNWCNCEHRIEEGNISLDMNNGQASDTNNLNADSQNIVF
ncbi:MAG: hypothetical protein IJT15_01220 [Rickettsiales bacterium]|nr:hypothetical protein [Rickettsiales bacterium]